MFFFSVAVDHGFFGDPLHHKLGDQIVGSRPDIDNLVVLLALGDQTLAVLHFDLLHFGFGAFDKRGFFRRNFEIVHADGSTGARRVLIAGVHQLIGEDHRSFQAHGAIALVDNLRNRPLDHGLVDHIVGNALGHDIPEQRPPHGGVENDGALFALTIIGDHHFVDAHFDTRMQMRLAGHVSAMHFVVVGKYAAFATRVHALASHVVQTQHHVLGRHDDRLAVGGRKDVVGRHHQGPRLELGFQGQRHVYGHLIAVKIRVVGRAHQRVKLNRLALDQHGLEGLNTETVQRGRPVQQHRMLADHFGQDVPDFRRLALDHFLGGLDRGGQPPGFQLAENKGLEQLKGHFFGQAALMQLERRPHHDHGTTGVIDALTEQVLTEAALLAFNHIGQRLQRTLVGTGNRAPAATVIEQRIHGFLQHALLIAHDNVRRVEVQKPLEAVVAIDHAAIQIVQIRGRKAAAIQRHQRTQVRRQHGQHVKHHPLGFVTGADEGLHKFQTLGQFLDLGLGIGRRDFLAQLGNFAGEIELPHKVLHRLGAHLGGEFVTELFHGLVILLIGEQLSVLQRGHTGVGNHIGFEIQHPLDIAQGHIQQQADARRQ